MIRVLQVVTQMNRAGLETMLMNYHRNIDKTQVQFDYLVHRKEKAAYDDEIIRLGGKIYRLNNVNPFSPIYRKQLDSFFKEHDEYKIVHSHINCLSALPLKYAKKNGVPVRISHSHISDNQKFSIKNTIKLFYRTQLQKYTTKQFACGEKAGKWLYQGGEFEVLPNAIDALNYRFNEEIRLNIRERLALKDAVVIGHVGRFNHQKNHLFLLEIFREYKKINDNTKLLLIGQGEEEENVRNKVNEYGLEKDVLFLGSRSDVNELMQAMDVFVMPSLFEGLPVTMVEAQAAGLQCVISDMVSDECIMSDNVSICNLLDDASIWAEKIQEVIVKGHNDTYLEIVNAHYDIKENSKFLCNYYLNSYK